MPPHTSTLGDSITTNWFYTRTNACLGMMDSYRNNNYLMVMDQWNEIKCHFRGEVMWDTFYKVEANNYINYTIILI